MGYASGSRSTPDDSTHSEQLPTRAPRITTGPVVEAVYSRILTSEDLNSGKTGLNETSCVLLIKKFSRDGCRWIGTHVHIPMMKRKNMQVATIRPWLLLNTAALKHMFVFFFMS